MNSPTTSRRYHHGDLRAELLERAVQALRVTSARELSLRELAREIGVSHSAPRRHFPDKDALLAALAEEGFHRLGGCLSAALDDAAPTFEDWLLAFARGYVRFAVEHGALLEVMFARKHQPGAVAQASEQAFATPLALLAAAQCDGEVIDGDLEGIVIAIVATLHGLAAMVGAGMLAAAAVDASVEELVGRLLLGLRPR